MTYYNRDTERTIYRMVNFCGKMRKTTSGNKLIKDSCYMEENIEGGFDVEACACDYNLCNHSSNVFFQSHWLIVVIVLRGESKKMRLGQIQSYNETFLFLIRFC